MRVIDSLTVYAISFKNDIIQNRLNNKRISASQLIISKTLKKIDYYKKKLDCIPVEQTTPQLIKKRIMFPEYVSRILDNNLNFIIYLDLIHPHLAQIDIHKLIIKKYKYNSIKRSK